MRLVYEAEKTFKLCLQQLALFEVSLNTVQRILKAEVMRVPIGDDAAMTVRILVVNSITHEIDRPPILSASARVDIGNIYQSSREQTQTYGFTYIAHMQ